MKTLLVAVDGSEPSLKGVSAALELSRGLGARLELVFVIPPVLLPPSTYAETIKKLEEANGAMAKDALEKAKAIVVAGGAQCDLITMHGAPAESLADSLRPNGCGASSSARKGTTRSLGCCSGARPTASCTSARSPC